MTTLRNKKDVPTPVMAAVARVLPRYYTHAQLDGLFMLVNLAPPGGAPSKEEKCLVQLRRLNEAADPLVALGELLGDLLDARMLPNDPSCTDDRDAIVRALGRHDLCYQPGGHILSSTQTATARSLAELIRERNMSALEDQFSRALQNVENDPPAAVGAACSIVETFCRIYIEDEGLEMPVRKDIANLWKPVQRNLRLHPENLVPRRRQEGLSIETAACAIRRQRLTRAGRVLAGDMAGPRQAELAGWPAWVRGAPPIRAEGWPHEPHDTSVRARSRGRRAPPFA